MLVVSGLGTLGDLHDDLVSLKKRVDQCVRAFPLSSSNADADMALTCDMQVGGADGRSGLPQFEKLSFVEPIDNAIMLDVARTVLTNWRNTAVGSGVSSTEATARRIAAQKLGEEPILEVPGSAVLAAQTLASAGRIEGNRDVKLAIIKSLGYLLRTRDENVIPSSVRTEMITTLKIFADPNVQSDPFVLNAANDVLKNLFTIEIGPITITPVEKPPSKYKIPLIAMGITAVLATGGLIWFFRRPAAHTLRMGPLRRKVEARRRR